jgi:hypothetical protein
VTTDTDRAANCASTSCSDAPNRTAFILTVMMVAHILLMYAHCTLLQNTEALCHQPLWNTRGRCTWRRTRAPYCCAFLRAVQHRNTGKIVWLLFSYKSQKNRGYRYFLKQTTTSVHSAVCPFMPHSCICFII